MVNNIQSNHSHISLKFSVTIRLLESNLKFWETKLGSSRYRYLITYSVIKRYFFNAEQEVAETSYNLGECWACAHPEIRPRPVDKHTYLCYTMAFFNKIISKVTKHKFMAATIYWMQYQNISRLTNWQNDQNDSTNGCKKVAHNDFLLLSVTNSTFLSSFFSTNVQLLNW